jgi:hypothetical protein
MLIAVLLTAVISCKKSFLEIKPKGRVIATKTSDYDLLLNNLDLMNINADGHILMGDEVTVTEPQWSSALFREKELFKWNPDIYRADEDAKESAVPVKGLYIYNKIINEVMESTEGSELTKKSLQAEALAGRAWTNFLLVNFYGKPYSAATASTDPGFALLTKADINQEDHRRATVQQVYDLIVSDLTTAIPNFINVGVPHRMRMSKAAAQGLLAKVYVFMGKFSDALPLLNESISNLTQSLAPTLLLNYNTAFPGFPTAPNDQENVYGKIIFNNYTGTGNRLLWITPETRALYGATDVRLTKWIAAGTAYPNGLTLYRRSGSFSAYIGLRVPELYLLRAEVKARANDLPGAVADLLTLRQNRMPAADAPVPPAVAADKLLLLQFIMEERIREFAVQGYRWFDMRRLSVDPLFTTPSYKHRVYDATGAIKETFTLAPERFVFRIPPKILAENPNMQDNP